MKARNETRERTSQVLSGSASLRDSIQATIKSQPDKTAVETLQELRDIKAEIKAGNEAKVAEAAARAG